MTSMRWGEQYCVIHVTSELLAMGGGDLHLYAATHKDIPDPHKHECTGQNIKSSRRAFFRMGEPSKWQPQRGRRGKGEFLAFPNRPTRIVPLTQRSSIVYKADYGWRKNVRTRYSSVACVPSFPNNYIYL